MRRPRVLIIDDEEDFRDILSQVLEREGWRALCAADGPSGLEMLGREKPDAVILDVNMPLRDGYQICRDIRSDPESAETPVLMLTIRNKDQEIIRGLEEGADDYLAKPFEPAELIARLRRLLERS